MADSAPSSSLITGATRGIGLGISRMLALKGWGLTVAARDAERLALVASQLRELGAPHVVECPGDLADRDWSSMAAKSHDDAFGSMNCLVLNAGVGTAGDIGSYPMSRFDKTVAINLRAPFALLQESLPLLVAAATKDPSRGSRVIALSSITGIYAEPRLAAYGATKAALVSLVASLNSETSGSGVSGTAIAPGYVETDMSSWIQDQIPGAEMIPVDDVVRVVKSLVELSARSVIAQIVMSRAGTSGHVA